jgi:hypothetical protein
VLCCEVDGVPIWQLVLSISNRLRRNIVTQHTLAAIVSKAPSSFILSTHSSYVADLGFSACLAIAQLRLSACASIECEDSVVQPSNFADDLWACHCDLAVGG